MAKSYSLYELNEYIKRVIALNFEEPIWVNCEIAQIKEVRGNVYLDLIHHNTDTNEVDAQISGAIWYTSYLFIKNKLGTLLPSILAQGVHVMIKVKIEFNERYGMKLLIEDIDPNFTIGQMEMNRQKILTNLATEGLINLNKEKALPCVIKKIAVISSATAAGYIDFAQHLANNSYGYKIISTLYTVSLQGQNTEREVVAAMIKINEKADKYDCILIIRGGGSKLDLSSFDSYNIGAAIAKSKLPVLTGIGHDIDSTVADVVAYMTLKTPTAVADFVIEYNLNFEDKVEETMSRIIQVARMITKNESNLLQYAMQLLQRIPVEITSKQLIKIDHVNLNLKQVTKNILSKNKETLRLYDDTLGFLQISNTLKRGYVIASQNEKILTRSNQVESGLLTLTFYDNEIKTNTK